MSTHVMDSLVCFLPRHPTATGVNVCFYDTSMPATLMEQYTRLVKTTVKDRSKIKFLDKKLRNPPVTTADRLYFPFNLDQKHWVGICVDTMEGTIYILDCNTSFKNESQMKKELNPIAPFSVVRCGGIAQNNNPLDAAITTVLLIKGHSAGGLPGCKAITPTVITDAAKLFVLRFFEYICDNAGLPKPPSVECLYEKMVDNLNILGHINIALDVAVPTGEFLSIAQRTQPMTAQVMDSLVRFLPRHPTATGVNVCFCDTSMPATLMEQYARLVKTAVKDKSKIKFLDKKLRNPPVTTANSLYFPFNLDQKHWVGICFDTMEGTIYILDCNTSFKTESQMKKELNPIAVIFTYILRARDPTAPASLLKPFSVVRCGGIAQNNNPLDAAITTVLLIKGHSVGGLPGCKAITPTVITDAAKLFVLRFFEYICDNAGLPKVE
ncbi:hypothetical protein F2Q69_00001822 [Brassica cretica]|uniref:Ubiquitin-like protease family profile domain-containing protein n=1 Tax=Brassica cretica TaxID=69181 RepID=A0A8S9P9Q3_BRACR|nr:hypothetical protein F2Q69_00001822 [Brassica cretica]